MGQWLKELWTDEAKFMATARGVIGMAGAALTLLPAEKLAGWGKWGVLVMALGLFFKAGDRNPR